MFTSDPEQYLNTRFWFQGATLHPSRLPTDPDVRSPTHSCHVCPIRHFFEEILYYSVGRYTLKKTVVFGLLLAFQAGPVTAQTAEWSDLERITIFANGMVFDALAAGPEDGEPVLLLHGFPQTGYTFRHQLRALATAGFRAVAPNQRGYSTGARPLEIGEYRMGKLVGDVAAIASALDMREFHLVGHDWGGAVAWVVAARLSDRVKTLTVLSTPHFGALGAASRDPSTDQGQRSSYFADFAAPDSQDRFLANNARWLRTALQNSGATPADIEVYLETLGNREALGAALNWYRALLSPQTSASPFGSPPATSASSAPPTLYVWGARDQSFGRAAAEATAEFVRGPYQFVELPRNGHWLPEAAADTVTTLLLEHIGGSR